LNTPTIVLTSIILLSSLHFVDAFAASSAQSNDLKKFQNWADDHDIKLQGTNKKTNQLYSNGWVQSRDGVDWKSIPNNLNVYYALSKLPEDVLKVAKGQTLYLSNQNGRSYTVLGSWPSNHILENMNKGIILEQPISIQTVVHEFGHLVDFNGIQCNYGCSITNYNTMKSQRMTIFAIPQPGYISNYAKTNTNENFAENFAYYVNRPITYTTKLLQDPSLKNEYNFLKNIIFSGKVYS